MYYLSQKMVEKYNPQIPPLETNQSPYSAEGTQHLQGITNGFNQNPVAFAPDGCCAV